MKILITGCSRGIGLELAKQALERQDQVLAIAREPEASKELLSLKEKHGSQIQIQKLDVAEDKAPEKLLKAAKDFGGVDILINNAGIMRKGTSTKDLADSYQVNCIAPLQIIEALLPILKESKSPKAISISSMMGSIKDNTSGGYYAYRSSKTALNMINKSLSIDHPWLTAMVLHPGWVKTDMGGAGATLSIPDSVKGLWSIIIEAGPQQSGKFLNYDGKELAW